MLTTFNAIASPLPWQADAWQTLQRAASESHLPHALLLRGPAHTGKAQFAIAFAQFLLCESPKAGIACGQCKACHLLQSGTHPDLLRVEPEEPGKAIVVDQIRALTEFCSHSAQFEGYRVVIIAPAEAMNVNASNALLKSLEEPGSKTILLLVSHQFGSLLATIKSRCQSIDFAIPPAPMALEWLTPLIQDSAKAEALLAVANGAPMQAIHLNDSGGLAERTAVLKTWGNLIKEAIDPTKAAQQYQDVNLDTLLDWMMSWQIDYQRYLGAGQGAMTNQDLLPYFTYFQPRISAAASQDFYEYLQSLRAMLNRKANPNKTLMLEELCIRWVYAAKKA